jgi:hypothetical protein
VYDDNRVTAVNAGTAQSFDHPRRRRRILTHLHRIPRRVIRLDAERRQQIPLVGDGMARRQIG